jgi:hypothetical protein
MVDPQELKCVDGTAKVDPGPDTNILDGEGVHQ